MALAARTLYWRLDSETGTQDGTGDNATFGKFQVAEWGDITVALVNGDWDGPYKAVRLN